MGWGCLFLSQSMIICCLIHDLTSVLHHQVICWCRAGCNYLYYLSNKPFDLVGVRSVCHAFCSQGDTAGVFLAKDQESLVVTVWLNPQCRN